jgi:methionyl-tRNA synthetase
MPKETFFLTTAIDYINARPHIGHALEKIAADALARYRRLRGEEVHLLIGTDEHSLNVQRQAEKEGITPRAYCDRMVAHWIESWKSLRISYDGFIRTTDPKHEAAVQGLFRLLHEKGFLYEGDYEGLYCASCENYYTEKEAANLQCPIHQRPLESVKEKNLFFRLTAFQEPLQKLIESGELRIEPLIRRNEILGLLREGLQDVSFTRTNVKWGVPCPVRPEQTIWIWFDALINYISAVGYGQDEAQFARLWPADVHIIGKDIIRFHCTIWPAMLLAAGVPLPKLIFAHGFVSVEGEKLSKTRGNIIEPAQVLEKFDADVLRYYLLREVPFSGDGDFSWARIENRYNSDLANDLGNLVNRTLSMIKRYHAGVVPPPAAYDALDLEVQSLARGTTEKHQTAFDALDFKSALDAVWTFVTRCNQYVEQNAPWSLAKDKAKTPRLATVLYTLAESCRVISLLIAPVLPATAEKIRSQLGIANNPVRQSDATKWNVLPVGISVGEIAPLFPRREPQPAKSA